MGPLTPRVPRVSEPCSCFIDLNADLMLFCEFCNSKCVGPNGVIQILLDSQGSLVFKKNMILAYVVEVLDELNRDLKCVFKCM